MSTQLRVILAALITLTSLMCSTAPLGANSIERTDSVVSELTGVTIEIDIDAGAAFVPELFTRGESEGVEYESFLVANASMDFEIYIADDPGTSPQQMLDVWEETVVPNFPEFLRLGTESDDEPAWGLYDFAHYLDHRALSYIEFRINDIGAYDVFIAITGAEAFFETNLAWVQDHIRVDGGSAIPNTDVDFISSVATGNSSLEPVDLSVQNTTVSDWTDDGLISEREWQGPVFETNFSWESDLWQLSYNDSGAIHIDHRNSTQTVILKTPDRNGQTKLRTHESEMSPADWVEWWLSDEYRARDSGFDFTVIDSFSDETTGSVILRFNALYGEPVYVIRDVFINDEGVTVLTEVFAAPEEFSSVYSDFWNGVQSNGEYYPLTWSSEDIENLEIN